jgi:hypothetical protein
MVSSAGAEPPAIRARSCAWLSRVGSAGAVFLALVPAPPARAEIRSEVRVLTLYRSGDFGLTGGTRILAVPATYAVISDRQEFRLTVPFLSVTSDDPVTIVGDQVIERPGGLGGTESGLGDVVAEEEHFFLAGGGARPWLSLLLSVKLPTADEDRGLGTGRPDAGAGMGLIQPLGTRWHLLGEAQYSVLGDPPDLDLRNTLWLSLGLQRRVSGSASASLSIERRNSVLRDLPDIARFGLIYDQGLARRVNLRAALFLGLSDTAEDYGVEAGFSVH